MTHSVKQSLEWPLEVVGTGFTALDRVVSEDHVSIETLGGSCGNVLISLAMLGRRVAPVLELGDDDTAARLIEEFLEAGTDTTYVRRRQGMTTPIVEQTNDRATGQHRFSFVCGAHGGGRASYQPATRLLFEKAYRAVTCCRVFYADRTNTDILWTMRLAKEKGATVIFEPSDFSDRAAVDEACSVADIVKVSSDRLKSDILRSAQFVIVTHGSRGLELISSDASSWFPAVEASRFEDACGSGDMVTVALIDALLSSDGRRQETALHETVARGLMLGQRVAAANCAYVGARGMFRVEGSPYVRALLA